MGLAKNTLLICQFSNLTINISMDNIYLLFVKYGKQEGRRTLTWKPNDELLEKNKICTISFSVLSSCFLHRRLLSSKGSSVRIRAQ